MTSIPFVRVQLDVERHVELDTMADLVGVLTDLGLASAAQEQFWVVSLDSRNAIRTINI
jgi:hypothetical protein